MNQAENSRILVDAAAERVDAQSVRICWESAHDAEVAVYAGKRPDGPDRHEPVALSDHGCVEVGELDPLARYYFVLEAHEERLMTAERRVYMENTVNFRDLGGYETEDGRRVRWGHVFRSDGLARLSDRDLERFRQMCIRRVYDLRTHSERAGAPDRLPEDGSVFHFHLPVSHGRFDFAEAMKRLKKGDTSWLTPDFMVNGYIRNLEDFSAYWAEIIRVLAGQQNDPVVFHCTGGKDRTGTCAALILLALGVPEETVIDDHQLSNIYIAGLLPQLYRMMEKEGVDPNAIFPYLTAPRECIVAVVDYITENYGTARDYLIKKAGLSAAELWGLQQNLLV